MQLEDLLVYQKLCDLTLEVHDISMRFPKFEMYELGSQVRRSSNSAAANLAEGFSNKHTNIYTECISRSLAEIRETIHHLKIAYRKDYLDQKLFSNVESKYNECTKMLYGLEKSLVATPRKQLKPTN